jgi:peroxiredoxin
LFFYPQSFTSVCTEEAHLFAEAMDAFSQAGAKVIGVSSDTIATQRKFSSMECRDKFPVAADPELKVIKAYGVGFGVAGAILPFADRVSFVIAPDGNVLARVKSSSAQPHVEQSLAAVKAWAASARVER